MPDFQKVSKTYQKSIIDAPTAPNVTHAELVSGAGELLDPNSGQLSSTPPEASQTLGVTQEAAAPDSINTSVIDAAKIGDKAGELADTFTSAKGTVDKNSTVQGQMENLQEGFKDGATPAWAAGALRGADAAMQARGLGASSIAGAARTQAAIEAALPIAQQDAQTSFQMQMANLSNEQQVLVQKNDLRAQGLLSDIATENATRQFNASSENQTKQFNANLKAQVEQFNKSQINSMSDANAGRADAMATFKAQMQDQREQFNAQNRLIIDQANAKWRQLVTTTNNAEANEANRLQAQIISEMTLADYNSRAQARRDAMNYAFTAQQNEAARATELLIATMSKDEAARARKSSSRDAIWGAVGTVAAAWMRK